MKNILLRKKHVFKTENPNQFKDQLLSWSQQFDTVLWLDSNQYNHDYSDFDAIIAVDVLTSIQSNFYNAFDKLKEYQSVTKDWIFGYLSYDLKNDIENLRSDNYD